MIGIGSGAQKHAELFATLYEASQHALTIHTTGKCLYVIVDALDECQDGCFLASSLITVLNASKRAFKLLLTSREELDLLELFDRYWTSSSRLQIQERKYLTLSASLESSHTDRGLGISYVHHTVMQFVRQSVTREKNGTAIVVQAATKGSWLSIADAARHEMATSMPCIAEVRDWPEMKSASLIVRSGSGLNFEEILEEILPMADKAVILYFTLRKTLRIGMLRIRVAPASVTRGNGIFR
ncbi:hypothetical protein ETB97_008284 [Aspergillus alliaceus]|uniref:Nephrocystin 3-like N-terminal domain-containing protein n=1 Tax=Petromyces alliaceus TaxID=209559 RepID=A0A8H5ZWW2_PETAA|nr:hypothetical protein ETB97_008284 [Aspergillus burnettii]